MIHSQNQVRNDLLRRLSPADFALLAGQMEALPVEWGHCLSGPNQPVEHVCFPEHGLASVTMGADPSRVEVGIIGREGLVGLPVLLGGVSCIHNTFVQMPGLFLRVPADHFRSALASSRTMTSFFLLYVQAYLVQVSCTAVANATFTVEQRLARWLLMAHDRADGDEVAITHEFLSMMLGVRRPGVTVATHVLEGEHLIRATRGRIGITDRVGLEAFSEGSYGRPESEYERLVGSLPAFASGLDPGSFPDPRPSTVQS